MFRYLALLMSVFLMTGCKNKEKNIDDLNSIKKNFIYSILESGVEESPFHMNYALKTVFFSSDVVSLLGEVHIYDHLPHERCRYEGKTFCKVQGKLREIKLWDLFPLLQQKEFLRKTCEDYLRADATSYFNGKDPLRTKLEYEDICTFIIDDTCLIIFFQPYVVGGVGDGPFHVKIPYEHLRDQWNRDHPLPQLLHKILVSKSYTTS